MCNLKNSLSIYVPYLSVQKLKIKMNFIFVGAGVNLFAYNL